MPTFILEIGTEELPSRFLADAEKELATRLQAGFEEHGLTYEGVTVTSTPRRLVYYVNNMAETAIFKEEVIMGPPMKAAYDVGGRPTRAAEGFAKTHNVTLEDTFTVDTDKGAYLAVRKNTGGEKAADLLPAICAAVVGSLPFPKRMRWGASEFTFARPLRWVLCLLGSQPITFTVGPVTSGNQTYGHRVHGAGPFVVPTAADYFGVMKDQGHVVVEGQERLQRIQNDGTRLAKEKGGVVLWKQSLLQEVQGLCEHPVPILGAFDPAFLEVPREVLLTSMESHQKSFGLENSDGRLLPYFLTVLNIDPQELSLVQKGWERVLRARLEDARFFWKTDLAAGFEPWLHALDSVIFLAPLGSMGEKTRRVSRLCQWLAENVASTTPGFVVAPEDAARAGRLSKADLVSEMVKEFDTLQGIMGGIYAARAGEHEAVAGALAEQYLPAGPESPVPASACGALLSMADKADTLAGCFGLSMIPSGTADPYGLRRAALGIARIIKEKGLRLDVRVLLQKALENYSDVQWKLPADQALARLEEFFTQRLKHYFIAAGYNTLFVDSCLLAGSHDVCAVARRVEALAAESQKPDFEATVLTFKRMANITRKQAQEGGTPLTGEYKASLFAEAAEKRLAEEFERIIPEFDALWAKDDYAGLFGLILPLRPFVDAFFTDVMVMCEDEAVRTNRLNLITAIVQRLGKLADFSALQM